MKNIYLCAIMVCFVLFSCKKEQSKPTAEIVNATGKKYPVSLNLSEFSQTVTSMKSKNGATISASDTLPYSVTLEYFLFDSAGTPISKINQFANKLTSLSQKYLPNGDYSRPEMPFGTILDTLSSGKYTAVLLGTIDYQYGFNGRQDNTWFLNLSNLSETYIMDQGHLDYNTLKTGDTFFKRVDFAVGNQNTSQKVVLPRVTGKVDIIIEDKLPANAAKFDCKYIGASNELLFSTGTAGNGGATYGYDTTIYNDNYLYSPILIKESEKGTSNYLLSKFAFGKSDKAFTVEIRCYDSANKLIAKKVVNNVAVYPNKRTVLKGKLFDNKSQVGFMVSVNDQWDTKTEEINF